MSQQESIPTQVKDGDTTTILTEYKALRDEIMKRIEFRYQIINLILIVSGTFLTVGIQASIPASVLLVYPILALFLICSWAHNGVTTLRIAKYVRECIEQKMAGLSWEAYVKEQFPQYQPFGSLGFLSAAGLVITTQILAIGLALLKSNFTAIEIVLIVCGVLATVLTLILLRYVTRLRR